MGAVLPQLLARLLWDVHSDAGQDAPHALCTQGFPGTVTSREVPKAFPTWTPWLWVLGRLVAWKGAQRPSHLHSAVGFLPTENRCMFNKVQVLGRSRRSFLSGISLHA